MTWALTGVVAVATAAAGIAHFADAPALLTFVIATVALAGLAWLVSFATEQVGERFGPAITGLLQSTLGNLPEFFIVVFALSAGEIVVAQTSIIGSIFANALLVLGLVIVAGCHASADGVMRFHARLPKDNATLMLLASFLIVIVGISVATGDKASTSRDGDLDRRRDRAARHLRRVALRLHPLGREAGRRARRAAHLVDRCARAARRRPESAPRSCPTGSSTRCRRRWRRSASRRRSPVS